MIIIYEILLYYNFQIFFTIFFTINQIQYIYLKTLIINEKLITIEKIKSNNISDYGKFNNIANQQYKSINNKNRD